MTRCRYILTEISIDKQSINWRSYTEILRLCTAENADNQRKTPPNAGNT